MATLEIGCGNNKIKGAIGVDIKRTKATDLISDLNSFLPFKDCTFDIIYAVDVLEHVKDVILVMEEIHRVAKNGSKVFIRVPHFSSTHAYGDFTHKHFFSSESFKYFTGDFEQYDHYSSARFEKINITINFWKLNTINGISFLANKFPVFYEKYIPFIFTAMNIEIELKVRK